MSKIAETKALEEYPEEKHITYGIIPGGNPFEIDINTRERNGYVKGYDQAMQDFMEKAEDVISMISRHYVGEDYSFDQIWEQFKNYMQDESEK